MFPNVRLMVAAILAAIAGIGCGLGLFATFRVNHEPLVRLAEGSPPLQLVFADLALGSNPRAPLQARLPVSGAATVISVPVIVPTPGPAAEQAGGDAALAGDSGVEQAAVGTGAADPSEQPSTASLATAVAPEQSSVTPEATAAAPSQQAAIAAAQDQQQAAPAAAATPTGEQTAATNPANDPEPTSKPTGTSESKAAKPKATATRPAAQARRAAKTAARARRTATTVAQSVYQYSQPTYSQPTYTGTDGAARVSQPVKRVQIKRHRTAKKALPAAQSNPSATTAGLSGAQ